MTTPALVGSPGSVGSAVGSYTPSFGQATTAGNFLLAWVNSNNSAAPDEEGTYPVTLSGSDTGWTLVNWFGALSGYNWNGLYYKADCSASDSAPTFNDSGNTLTAACCEFSGVVTSSPLDQSARANDADPCQGSSPDTGDGDLIVAVSAWNGSNASPTIGQTVDGSTGSALTNTAIWDASGNSSAPFYRICYAINGTHASIPDKVSASISEYENSVSSIIASFLAAS